MHTIVSDCIMQSRFWSAHEPGTRYGGPGEAKGSSGDGKPSRDCAGMSHEIDAGAHLPEVVRLRDTDRQNMDIL